MLDALVTSLPELVRKFGAPDFIVASGDIAKAGKTDEYKFATKVFDDILAAANLPRNRLFVVPGNHDIDRSKAIGLARTLATSTEADAYFSPGNPLLHIEQRLKAYSDWYNTYFDGIRKFDENTTVSVERLSIGEKVVDIGLINTATFCFDDQDGGKLFIGRRSLDQLPVRSASEPTNLRLAIMHHPFSWLSAIEVTQVKAAMRDRFDCVLTGHLHGNEIESINGSSGEVLHLAAGAAYQTRTWPNTALFCAANHETVQVHPIHYADTPRAVWCLDTSLFPNSSDYSGTFQLKSELTSVLPATVSSSASSTKSNNLMSPQVLSLQQSFNERLFATPTGEVVYTEPRIMPRPQIATLDIADQTSVSIEEIALSTSSFLIHTRPEYGGSTLARAVELELEKSGIGTVLKNARSLPNYRKKLEGEFIGFTSGHIPKPVLVLDDFDTERDDRLIRELASTEWFDRVILISVNRRLIDATHSDAGENPFKPIALHLWAMGREAIRKFASVVLEPNDQISEAKAVDKVYSDLLALRIPLTPSNVLMYLRVLQREGDFEPLSRVDILSRYLAESLRKPSDVAVDSFNFKNKMDVLSAFAFNLHTEKMDNFDQRYWLNFCAAHQQNTLTEFDDQALLHELTEARILGSYQGSFYFKYSFYFTFFLGRYLWPRPSEIQKFFSGHDYLLAGNVIDVITGLSSENSEIVSLLLAKLNVHLAEFGEKYVRPDFDPLISAIWPSNDDEEEALWIPLQKALVKGPASSKEIDELKTSMMSEALTSNQRVTFERFAELESALFTEKYALADALKNADDIHRSLKLEAWEAILRANLVIFQVGTMFAPALAKRKIFQWGGIEFIDFDKAAEGLEEKPHEAFVSVITHLADAVAGKTAQDYGATKLSALFREISTSRSLSGFMELVNFTCLATARGRHWSEGCASIIEKTDKNAFYLRGQLQQLLSLMEFEIMTGHDREKMKSLIALIQAKRNFGKQTPGAKAVSKMVGVLERDNYFPEPKTEGDN